MPGCCTQDAAGATDGGGSGKNILMLTDLRRSSTYTCVASSDLGNIAYDVDVVVKGTPNPIVLVLIE